MSVATYAAARLIRALPRARINQAVGAICERPLPGPLSAMVTHAYSWMFNVNLEECEGERPYRSFDEFFTRPLRPGVRPLAQVPVVSPADGRVRAAGRIGQDARLSVKGHDYSLAELLQDDDAARAFQGGNFSIIYLSPADYHRVHSPVDGALLALRSVRGDFFPVNSIGERWVPGLYNTNHRVVLHLHGPETGHCAVVMVGAAVVGRISVKAAGGVVPPGLRMFAAPVSVRRGDELGAFHIGSTVVLLTERGPELGRPPGPVLVGQTLLEAR